MNTMATYKDGHFFCKTHGDLGEHDKAIENETVLYSGEDQLDGFMCMACLEEDRASQPPACRTIYIASSVSLFTTPEYEQVQDLVSRAYPQDNLVFAKGLYSSSQEWLTKWPLLCQEIDILLFFTHDGWIGKGVYKELCDIEKQGKPLFFVELDGTHHALSSIPVDVDFSTSIVNGITFEFNTASWRQYARISVEDADEEPLLQKCSYCGQHHPVATGEWYCPLKPT